ATLAEAQEAGAATLNYGVFITAIINFLLMALVIFCMIKFLNGVADKVKKSEEAAEEAAPTEKECPYCCAMIPIGAKKCMHCTSSLE
ncbi:MAG: MscL family protein, partial [Lachnospiraceae bacterium]|nr:MscL family protein [Lachnospiraceae bacterium]